MSNKSSNAALINSHISILGEIIESLSQQYEKQKTNLLPFSSQQQEQLIKSWLALLKLKLPEMIDAIEELPIIPILPDSDNLKAYLEEWQLYNRAIAVWLRAMLLDKPIDKNKLQINVNRTYNPSSEGFKFISIELLPYLPTELPKFSTELPLDLLDRSFAYAVLLQETLNLARKTYPWSHDLKTLFPSAEALWICCEFSVSRGSARERGLTGTPVIRSKRRTNDYITESIKNLKDLELDNQADVVKGNLTIVDRSEHIIDILFNHAARLYEGGDFTKDDGCKFSSFYDEEYSRVYEKYWQLWRYINNLTRNDSRYQKSYLLPNDQIFISGQNNKIPKDFAPAKWERKTNEDRM
jgi:hypothetical protein